MDRFVTVSEKDPHYFAFSDGRTYLPTGVNLSFVRNSENMPDDEVLKLYYHWLESLAENGGNFARLWIGVPFFDVMPEKAGEFCKKNLDHLCMVVRRAEKLNVKLKITFEHFRRTAPTVSDAESFPGVVSFTNTVYYPFAKTMQEYCESPECRAFYLAKAKYVADAIGNSPSLIAVELWNEINCIGPLDGYVGAWTRYMIPELEKLFPHQMVVQNVGSFSSPYCFEIYNELGKTEGNTFMQAHRYVDPGAEFDVCRGPMDRLAADSIAELLKRCPGKPAILAETGAVEACHCRYSDLYQYDTEGTLLHDGMFAPFFAGSAGCGQFWHWDYIYIDKHNLWYHFRRFTESVKGIDPAEEHFVPMYYETKDLRIYLLEGKHHDLYWCRDKASCWQSELGEKKPAGLLVDEVLPLNKSGSTEAYLPWEDRRENIVPDGKNCKLPPFRRSIVLKVTK